MNGILADIFPAVGDIVEGFISMLSSALNGVVSIFYTAGVDGAAGSLTVLGWFVLIPVAASLVYWGIGLFVRLINKLRTNKSINV